MEEGFDAVNVARLGDLAAGRPLTPGPATPARQTENLPPETGGAAR